MRKSIVPLILASCFSFSFFPVLKANSKNAAASAFAVKKGGNDSSLLAAEDREAGIRTASALLYDRLQLKKLGLSQEAMLYAYKGYQYLLNKGALRNPGVLTVVDFSQSSRKKRMYILDVKNVKVLMNTFVAHGRNSGVDQAEKFSNIPESLQSSLGFYVTKDTYFGKHGLSLRLDGQDRGFNDKAEERAIVVHGASYIGAWRVNSAYMGRSFGCPAVPENEAPEVINYIKNGTCLFIYHPSAAYLHGSKILNG